MHSESFLQSIESAGRAGAVPSSPPSFGRDLAFGLAASVWRAPRAALAGRNRSRRHARARRLALHLAHVGLGVSLTRASAALSRDRASARRACARVEDSRDCPRWDRALDGLERALRLWCGVFSGQSGEGAR